MMLQISLYGLENASKIWLESIKKKFEAAGLREMQAAACVFHDDYIKAVCYVDDLTVFKGKREFKPAESNFM